jgi:hypothetical protein
MVYEIIEKIDLSINFVYTTLRKNEDFTYYTEY